MSLEKEIFDILYKFKRTEDKYEMAEIMTTKKILSIFEKRIDAINTTGMVPNDLPSIDPRVYKRGFYDGISYVKEMLK